MIIPSSVCCCCCPGRWITRYTYRKEKRVRVKGGRNRLVVLCQVGLSFQSVISLSLSLSLLWKKNNILYRASSSETGGHLLSAGLSILFSCCCCWMAKERRRIRVLLLLLLVFFASQQRRSKTSRRCTFTHSAELHIYTLCVCVCFFLMEFLLLCSNLPVQQQFSQDDSSQFLFISIEIKE